MNSSTSKIQCKWCLHLFEIEFMASPNQCMGCFNNPWRTKEAIKN